MAKQNRRAAELAGEVPALATVTDDQDRGSSPRLGAARKSRKPGRINLRAVAEVLAEEGLDPAAEMVRILREQIPVTTRHGDPVIDPETGKQRMVDAVDTDTKLRMLNELLQYTQPKLKSVEVKVDPSSELTDEQLDKRIAALLAKAVQ